MKTVRGMPPADLHVVVAGLAVNRDRRKAGSGKDTLRLAADEHHDVAAVTLGHNANGIASQRAADEQRVGIAGTLTDGHRRYLGGVRGRGVGRELVMNCHQHRVGAVAGVRVIANHRVYMGDRVEFNCSRTGAAIASSNVGGIVVGKRARRITEIRLWPTRIGKLSNSHHAQGLRRGR